MDIEYQPACDGSMADGHVLTRIITSAMRGGRLARSVSNPDDNVVAIDPNARTMQRMSRRRRGRHEAQLLDKGARRKQ